MNRRINLHIWMILLLVFSLSGCSQNSDPKDLPSIQDTGQDKEQGQTGNQKGQENPLISEDMVYFSLEEPFYDRDMNLQITAGKSGTIYYTLDGEEPDRTKEKYSGSISLNGAREIAVYPVKAKAYFDDGTESNTVVRTYFVGENVHNRYDTLVFSVVTDPYNLYDYEYGIFVEGKLRDDYIRENPGKHINPPDPANYNMRGRESERPIHVEIFNPDGSRITEQAAGIRTYGGWSRANLQKSVKIFTRKSYDEEKNKIRYELFPDRMDHKGEKPADAFNRLVLRNSGNDNGFGFIRDEFFQTLAKEAGYQDYQSVRPAVLYVNGEYRGVYWLHEVYGDEYFDEYYGNYDGAFEILEGGETYKAADDDGENSLAVGDYELMYEYAWKDLTDDNTYAELSELMDIKNYLEYYALQIYIGNEDWPGNNYKVYRYYATEGEPYREAPFDGKWRYLFHDLDFSFGIYGASPQDNNVGKYVGRKGELKEEAPMFSQLMRRKECRDIFLAKTLDLLNGAFQPDHLNAVLDKLDASRRNEQYYMYNRQLVADWVQFDQLDGRMEEIRVYGMMRASYILSSYKNYFQTGEIYTLNLKPAENTMIRVNSNEVNEEYQGKYYEGVPTRLNPTLYGVQRFDYWEVNGEKIKDKELVLNGSYVKDGVVQVVLHTK